MHAGNPRFSKKSYYFVRATRGKKSFFLRCTFFFFLNRPEVRYKHSLFFKSYIPLFLFNARKYYPVPCLHDGVPNPWCFNLWPIHLSKFAGLAQVCLVWSSQQCRFPFSRYYNELIELFMFAWDKYLSIWCPIPHIFWPSVVCSSVVLLHTPKRHMAYQTPIISSCNHLNCP